MADTHHSAAAGPPRLVIFDCDGVLVDTERIAVPIDVKLLADAGWELSAEEVVERWLGRSEADCLREIEEHFGHPLGDLKLESDDRYREAFERELEPVPGVVAMLDRLEASGVRTCVASSGTHDKIRFTLGLTGLYERFAAPGTTGSSARAIFSAEDVENGKPAPDLFLHAAAVMGASPPECAVIEDSPFGLEAALAAGMRAFAYAGGLTPRHRLEVPGAVLFDKMDELPGLLGLA